MAVDLQGLWDFSDPASSEVRFRAALATALYGLKGDADRIAHYAALRAAVTT